MAEIIAIRLFDALCWSRYVIIKNSTNYAHEEIKIQTLMSTFLKFLKCIVFGVGMGLMCQGRGLIIETTVLESRCLISVSKLGQHWLRQWLVAYSAPSNDLNQYALTIKEALGNKLQWNLNQNITISIYENVVCQLAAMLSRLQCVNWTLPTPRWWWYDKRYRLHVCRILVGYCFIRSGY